MRKKGIWRKDMERLTWVFLNEPVNVDTGAGAASIKHDPIKGATEVDRTRGHCFRHHRYLWRKLIVHVGMVIERTIAVVHMVVGICCLCQKVPGKKPHGHHRQKQHLLRHGFFLPRRHYKQLKA